jgi:hypothetical protein
VCVPYSILQQINFSDVLGLVPCPVESIVVHGSVRQWLLLLLLLLLFLAVDRIPSDLNLA